MQQNERTLSGAIIGSMGSHRISLLPGASALAGADDGLQHIPVRDEVRVAHVVVQAQHVAPAPVDAAGRDGRRPCACVGRGGRRLIWRRQLAAPHAVKHRERPRRLAALPQRADLHMQVFMRILSRVILGVFWFK